MYFWVVARLAWPRSSWGAGWASWTEGARGRSVASGTNRARTEGRAGRVVTAGHEGQVAWEAEFRREPEDIGEIYVRSKTTEDMIPLSTLVTIESVAGKRSRPKSA